MNAPRLLTGLLTSLLALVLTGCVNQSIKSTSVPAIETPSSSVAESLLLDVAVTVFDPGLDEYDEDEQVFPEVRKAESRFMPLQVAEAMQDSGAWGAVRVVPSDAQITDLTVRGKILHSDGEELKLAITATDSRGRVWLDNKYTGNASKYAYQPATRNPYDPFQAVYHTIANDLLRRLGGLEPGERKKVRTVTELRFARGFSPDAFDGYLEEDGDEYEVKRLPAEGDPMLERVREIRERDHMYVDTLQGYYTNFDAQMQNPYQEWRRNSYYAALAAQELKAESTRRLIAGGVAVLAGLAAATAGDSSTTRAAGQIGVLGGGYLLKSGLEKRNEAQFHVAELEELGASLEAEVTPQVIELEDQTVTLSGNVEEQYAQWRLVLMEIYRIEVGSLELPPDAVGTADTL